MKKQFARDLALAAAAALVLVQAAALPAEATAAADTTTEAAYTVYMADENGNRSASISAAETAAGDVVIPISVYLDGSTDRQFNLCQLKLKSSDENHLYFQNMQDGLTTYDTSSTYTISAGSFTTNYMPFCFGIYTARTGRYNAKVGATIIESNSEFMTQGATVYSAGSDKVYFKVLGNYGCGIWDEATQSYVRGDREYTCDVTENADGSGTFTYSYVDMFETTPTEEEITVTIPHYDPTIPAYDAEKSASENAASAIPGSSNMAYWVSPTATSFLGDASDEFPFCRVDLVIPQNTPAGVYTVSLSDETLSGGGKACQLVDSDRKDVSFEGDTFTVTVGAQSVQVVSIASQKDAAFYTSEDTTPISAADFASGILANITFTDGTVSENVDITNMVDCATITPKKLYDSQKSSDGFYASENSPLYYNGEVLKWTDGTTVTQNILVGMQGDVDFDGDVDTNDAYLTLLYYSQNFTGTTPKLYNGASQNAYAERLAIFLADTDTQNESGDRSAILANDAQNILEYYSIRTAGGTPSWSKYRAK